MSLATALCDAFTLYIPDRRGRGLSEPFGDNYGIQKEVEDLDALLIKTGAHNVFGLSSGALISLQASLALPAIRKAALYEPPLSIDHSILTTITPLMQRFDREIAEGNVAAALVTAVKDSGLWPFPEFKTRQDIVQVITSVLQEDARNVKGDDVSLQALVPTQHFDYQLVVETEGTLETFKAVPAEVLLLGGSERPPFLKPTLDALSKVLPHVRRVEFPGLGHSAPQDTGGELERVARELRRFFV